METHLEAHPADEFDPAHDHHLDDRMEPVLVFGIALLVVAGLVAEMIFAR